jgi:outer membrane immunogenic protein
VVLGVEADVTWFDVDANKTMSFSGQCESRLSDTQSVGAGVNWKATLRGRAGYLFNPTTLVYGTAGAAWANVSLSESSTTFPNCEEPVVAGGAADKTFFGGVFGGGVETHFNSSLLGRVEVLHFVFDDETVSVGGTPVSFDLDETIVRVALSIKLN